MKCRRAFDADLTAVVRGEAADADFTAHAATCPDCAAEVRVWTELDAMLRAGVPAPAEHPEPETLVAFVDAPATLASDERTTVERHLAACRVCADEVGSLRRFDPVRTAASTVAAADAVAPAAARDGIARVLWHPAFAYALVAVLLVPLVLQQLAHVPEASRIAAKPKEAELPIPQPAAPAEPARGLDAALNSAAAPESAPPAVPPPAPPPRAERLAKQAGPAEEPPALADRAVGQTLERRRQAPQQAPAAAAPEMRAELERDDEGAAPLAGLAGRAADTASARAPGASAPPVVIDLGSNEPTLASSAFADRPVRLRVVPPSDLGPGSLAVRVRDPSGTREITTRAAFRADAIVVDIPAGWLVPGDYVVTLAPLAGARENRALNLPFRVAGPGAPR